MCRRESTSIGLHGAKSSGLDYSNAVSANVSGREFIGKLEYPRTSPDTFEPGTAPMLVFAPKPKG
jgi:hypothetical protein